MTSRRQFPTTRWSVVLDAALGTAAPKKALHELCEAYWRPLYTFLRRDGHNQQDAEDTVQGFFAHLLAGPAIASVEPDRGRFRSYLLGALRHYVSNERAKAAALKRGGGERLVPLVINGAQIEGELELSDDHTPEDAYAHAWAMEILARTQRRLGEHYRRDDRGALFDALEPFLVSAETPAYRQVAAGLAMTEANTRVAVHRLRNRFRTMLREEVADTVASDADIDDEIRAVIAAIRS